MRRIGALAATLSLYAVVGRAAEPQGTLTSRESLSLCHRAQESSAAAPDALLERGLALANEAIAADPVDALAHFARFCALGEQARRSGASLSSLVKIWAIRDAIDRTLELAPEFPDALLGKGALLCSLPRLLGGDPVEGERLVRRALEVDPEYVGARLFLTETLLKRGDTTAARVEGRRAMEAADRKDDADGIEHARELLGQIDEKVAR